MAHQLNVSTDVRCRQADGLPIVSASVTSGPPLRGTDMLTLRLTLLFFRDLGVVLKS